MVTNKNQEDSIDLRQYLQQGDIQNISKRTDYDRNWVRTILARGYGNQKIIGEAIKVLKSRQQALEAVIRQYESRQ